MPLLAGVAAAALGVLGVSAWRRWRASRRVWKGEPAGDGPAEPEPTLAEAEAWLAQRAATRRAQALSHLDELRARLVDAAARCDAYLDGESEGLGPPEPPWQPYAHAGSIALAADREAYVIVSAACRGMETVAGAPAPERVEPVRRMIGRALGVLARVLD